MSEKPDMLCESAKYVPGVDAGQFEQKITSMT